MKPRAIAFSFFVFVVAIGLYWFTQSSSTDVDLGEELIISKETKIIEDNTVSDIRIPLSPMAKVLANPNSSAGDELQAVGNLFHYYTLGSTKTLPIGTNQEITKVLTQSIDSNLPSLPNKHRRINSEGQLVDHWDTPYFFHALSSEKMEVRSAGPDRVLYTEDDLLWPKNSKLNNPHPTFEKEVRIR